MNSFWGIIHYISPDWIWAFCGVFQKCPVWQTGCFTGFLGLQLPLFHAPRSIWWKRGVWRLSGGGAAGTGTNGAGIDGWDAGPDWTSRGFFYFLSWTFYDLLTIERINGNWVWSVKIFIALVRSLWLHTGFFRTVIFDPAIVRTSYILTANRWREIIF